MSHTLASRGPALFQISNAAAVAGLLELAGYRIYGVENRKHLNACANGSSSAESFVLHERSLISKLLASSQCDKRHCQRLKEVTESEVTVVNHCRNENHEKYAAVKIAVNRIHQAK